MTVRDVAAVAPNFPGVTTASVALSSGTVPIPDNSSAVSLLTVTNAGVAVDVDVTLEITHAQPDQLDIYLVSPLGTTVALSTDNAASLDDVFDGVTFDDQAPLRQGDTSTPNVRNVTFTMNVPIGAIQPEGAMGAFFGEPVTGPWALVVVDDQGGTNGNLVRWQLDLTILSSLPAAAPQQVFSGVGSHIDDPSQDPDGVSSPIVVSGAGRRLLDIAVGVDITHDQADQLDIRLTSPSGRTVDLVTDVGGGNDDLFYNATFYDKAPVTVSDLTPLPPNGESIGTVVPEGALGAFLGEDPNGTWTLNVMDDTNGIEGDLESWRLTLVTTAPCGDGVVDAGEACDDGNGTNGDGCDNNCAVSVCGNGLLGVNEECDDGNTVDGDGCSSTCQLPETACDDCQDNDGDGLTDAADPGCQAAPINLRKVLVSSKKGVSKLKVSGGLPVGPSGTGSLALVLADGNGTFFCGTIGELRRRGGKAVTAKGGAAGGTLTAVLQGKRGGSVLLKGSGLDLSALDDPNFIVGIRAGSQLFVGSGTLRTRGPKRVYP